MVAPGQCPIAHMASPPLHIILACNIDNDDVLTSKGVYDRMHSPLVHMDEWVLSGGDGWSLVVNQ